MTSVLHTASISNVNSIMFVNRIREMGSFMLGKEIKRDAFCLVISMGQRKKKKKSVLFRISFVKAVDCTLYWFKLHNKPHGISGEHKVSN